MPAAVSVLQIYDADETADLVDEDNIIIQNGGYAPAVAPRSLSPLSGRAYENVEEAARVDVTGSTGAAMLANVAKVARLLDKARRWAQTGQGNVVRLKVQAQGSNLSNPLEAVILGPPPGWSLPATFNDYLMVQEIENLVIPWLRRGELLGDEEVESSSTAQHPAIYTTSAATAHDGVAAAVDVEITGFSTTTHLKINEGILFVSGRPSGDTIKLAAYDAHNLTRTGWTAHTDTGKETGDAGGQVLRYTPTGTSESASNILEFSSLTFDASMERVAVAVTVRNNAASRTFYLRAEGFGYDGFAPSTTDTHVIDGSTYATPQPLLLGFLNIQGGVKRLRLVASVDSTFGSPTLDFDQIVILGMDDDGHIVKHGEKVLASPFASTGGGGETARIFVDHRLYQGLVPIVGMRSDTSANEAPVSYEGDSLITLRGELTDAYWMSCNGADWVDTNQSTGARITLGLTARRRPIFTVPA